MVLIMDTHTIKSAAELIAALHTQPKHNYPYRVFVAVGERPPFFERSVLLVRRNGDMFFRHPQADFMTCRLEDSEECRIALADWLSDAREVVELRPSRGIEFNTATGVTSREPSVYLSAVYVALSAWVRTTINGRFTARHATILSRLDAMYEWRRHFLAQRGPVAHWRGIPRLSAQQYLTLRITFKDPEFIAAVRAAVVDGHVDDLAEILKSYPPGSILERACDNDWLRRVTGVDLFRAGCGHVEYAEDVMTARNRGSTYCRWCGEEDLVFVTKCRAADRGWYHHEDVYYWESDGEYHLDPEPEQVAEWAQHQQPARSTGHE